MFDYENGASNRKSKEIDHRQNMSVKTHLPTMNGSRERAMLIDKDSIKTAILFFENKCIGNDMQAIFNKRSRCNLLNDKSSFIYLGNSL